MTKEQSRIRCNHCAYSFIGVLSKDVLICPNCRKYIHVKDLAIPVTNSSVASQNVVNSKKRSKIIIFAILAALLLFGGIKFVSKSSHSSYWIKHYSKAYRSGWNSEYIATGGAAYTAELNGTWKYGDGSYDYPLSISDCTEDTWLYYDSPGPRSEAIQGCRDYVKSNSFVSYEDYALINF